MRGRIPARCIPALHNPRRSPLRMDKHVASFSLVIAAAAALNAHAQQVWTYEIVRSNHDADVSFRAPRDLSYPSAGERAPEVFADSPQKGVRLTPREEARRLSAPQLVITLVPMQQANDIQSSGRY